MDRIILITGATGLIGRHIIPAILAEGDSFIALTTNMESAKKKLPEAKQIVDLKNFMLLKDEKIDGIINLAGLNLGDKRWNEAFKKAAYDSRIYTTAKIVELISAMKTKPEVLVSASGMDYYGDTGDKEIFEDAPPANDYMANLCKAWETEAMKAEQYGVRTVTVRTGFVMAKNSKAVDKLTMPFKFFIGGPTGSGKQIMSWIHIDDIVGIYIFALNNENVSGPINAAAPNPETMREFCKHMAHAMHRPSFFPVPAFVVKIVAGEMAQVVLGGRKISPEKIMRLGYKFKYEYAEDAWKDIFS